MKQTGSNTGSRWQSPKQIDFDRATIIEDRRFDYGEPRYIAFGRLAIGFTACGLPGEARTFG